MNKPQKNLTVVCLILFAATLLLCPWYNPRSKTATGFSPFFLAPMQPKHKEMSMFPDLTGGTNDNTYIVDAHRDSTDRIDLSKLWCEWIALGVIYTGLFFLFKKKNE